MYSIISIIAMVVVTVLCITTEIVSFRNKKNADASKFDIFRKIVEFTEKPTSAGVILLGLFAVFLASRLFHLGIAPTGINVDEAGMAYDAVCLANEGTDRWGNIRPVYLENYHTGQSALYAYIMSALLRFMPISAKAIRVPAVMVACGAFFAMYIIGKIITKKKLGGLFASALMIITPYFLMSERWALDCNLFLSMATISLALLLVALNSDKWTWYLLAGLSWGVTLYTYIISYIVVPLFILCVVGLMIVQLVKSRKAEGAVGVHGDRESKGCFSLVLRIVLLVVPIGIFGIPLLLEQLVNMGYLEPFSMLGSDYFVFSAERTEEIEFGNVIKNFGVLSKQLYCGDELSYNAIPQFGALLKPMLPLAVYGLYLCIKELIIEKGRKMEYYVVFSFFACAYIVILIMRIPNFNRYNEIFLPILIFMLIALWKMMNCSRLSGGVSGVTLLCICVCFAFFAKYYYCDMNDEYNPHLLHYSVEYADALSVARALYDPADSKHFYLEIEYDMATNSDLMVAAVGNVSSTDWRAYTNGETGNSLGKYDMHFTDSFDENEDAVYILGTSWNHISDYLVSIGFNEDRRFENYRILYR